MPDHTSTQLFQGMLIGALALLLPLFFTCFAFFRQFATQASLEKLEQRFVTDLATVEDRLTDTLGENRRIHEGHYVKQDAKLDHLTNTMQAFTNDLNRILGSQEGRLTLVEKLALEKKGDSRG